MSSWLNGNEANEELFRRILELPKDGYAGQHDPEGDLELRFFFLGQECGLNENRSLEIYEKMIELGVLEYNWDTVPFSISVERLDGIECVIFSINVSQNYLDEWHAIYLGMRVTEKIENLALRVCNESGDSVLVHLADVIPRWIKPYNSKNRCFVLNGRICLIDNEPCVGESETRDDFNELGFGFAVEKLRSMLIEKNELDCDIPSTEDEYTNLFMKKYQLIRKVNDQEKIHNFNVILPMKVARMILKFHYLISLSLKHLFEYGNDPLEVSELESERDMNDTMISEFFPDNLVRTRICVTRPQYSRLFSEGVFIKTPSVFSRRRWMSVAPKVYTDDVKRAEREVGFGRLICFGLYLAYIKNLKHCLNVFSWTYSNNDYWSLLDKEKIKSDLVSFSEKNGFCTASGRNESVGNEQCFQNLWNNFTYLVKGDDSTLDELLSHSENKDDSTEWLYNEKYTKDLIESVQLAHLYGNEGKNKFSDSDSKYKSFSEFLKAKSYLSEIDSDTYGDSSCNDSDSSQSDSEQDSGELLDYVIGERELAELEASTRQMDEELRRTLMTTVPVLGAEESEEFVENVYKETLMMEKMLGVMGPTGIMNRVNK
ncbi:hypothetical protein FG386_000135 [Cryptosporidium ryanae]|uniref:uncharacterized protein n=1 Tax=Cryptosporidium ryanae TaxID=515981 RepID=UPI00351A573F|nr:hypothetical protein FG386_000135 [Cryptosporidium ryanae]